MGKTLLLAAYIVYAAFWLRFFAHTLVWWRAAQRSQGPDGPRSRAQAWVFFAADVLFFMRLLAVNPALWLGEWVFHASFLLVLFRHLRYFLDPVPDWVWRMQTPGLVAGYVLPCSLAYILAVRLCTRHEKYAAPANVFLLGLVLVISSLGVVMHAVFKPDLVEVKWFILGILRFAPSGVPESLLFVLHFGLVLVLIPILPTHIFTAPLVMMAARKREQALRLVMHEK
jgi:nitrate reductase gamma subunit